MNEWTSIQELLIAGDWEPEHIAVAVLDSGVRKRVAFNKSVPATEAEKHLLCSWIELFHGYAMVLDYPVAEALKLVGKNKPGATFFNYGWSTTAMPRELTVGKCSLHEGRLRQAESLGFKAPTRSEGRLEGIGRIAKELGVERQVLSASIRKAIDERRASGRGASIVPP